MIIVWDKIGDSKFRDEYFLEVNEKIQTNPLENKEGTHYLIGSSRITEESAITLGVYYGNEKPDWWNDKPLEQ